MDVSGTSIAILKLRERISRFQEVNVMNKILMALTMAAGSFLFLAGCNDTTVTTPSKTIEHKVEAKTDDDGSKSTVKEKTVTVDPDGNKTKTETKTEVKKD